MNKTLLNASRAALHHAELHDTYWEVAFRDATYNYNMMRHSAHGQSALSLLHDRPRARNIYVRSSNSATFPSIASKNFNFSYMQFDICTV